MSPKHYTQIVLNERPIAHITLTTFRIETVPFNLKPGPGEILVQVDWLSQDPVMRNWIRDMRTYTTPVQIGEVMRAVGLATVAEVGEGSKFRPGDLVYCMPGESPNARLGNCAYGEGWTEFAVLKEESASQLE
jgi:NADPH-dependent curcumin reductase CurA